MTWVQGSHERTFEVEAPLEEVARFLSDPSQVRHCMVDLEKGEEIDDQTWRWTLEEVGAKNITFQGIYTVRYERDGDVVTWESVDDEGDTMRTEGRAELEAVDEETTRVDYEETITSDLPIPKLARRVFRPIARREVRKGVDAYVDAVISHLNAGRHRGDESS